MSLDRRIDEPGIHNVTQISRSRWNHQVEVKSPSIATCDWLHALIRAGYEFASQ